MKNQVINWIQGYYYHKDVFDQSAWDSDKILWTLGLFAALVLASVIVWFLSRLILIQIVHVVAIKSKSTWDDHLVHNRVFKGLALLVPLMFMEYFLSIAFFAYPDLLVYSNKVVMVLIILASIVIVNRVFNGVKDILMEFEAFKDKPIQSYTQILKIIISGILIIAILSVLTNKSPLFFLTSLGAISAILLLIFKDTILGFVGSIQLATYDMIRIGDWVTMEKYGADGDVEEINLTTVKVRNFDKTITTIPTYSFISDSFKNWRGMEESDGRRIKRSFRIHLDSVHFASPELVQKLMEIPSLKEFVEKRQKEIKAYNEENGYTGKMEIYGRRQTNLGLFRHYIEYYLKKNPGVNQNMTLMVRQLEATELGVPLEIYCFTKTKEWANYEVVIADIFDHLFAIIPEFELRLFERPAGHDFRSNG